MQESALSSAWKIFRNGLAIFVGVKGVFFELFLKSAVKSCNFYKKKKKSDTISFLLIRKIEA